MLMHSEHFNPPECFLLSAWVSPKEAKKGLKNVLKDPLTLFEKLLTPPVTLLTPILNVLDTLVQFKEKNIPWVNKIMKTGCGTSEGSLV